MTTLREPTRRRIESAVAAVTKGVLFGTERGDTVALGNILTTVQTADAQMTVALRKAEEAFFKYASGSKRALALGGQASPEEWALHRRTYSGACNTARSVNLVVKSAVLLFGHCIYCCSGFLNASEFQVAAWV